VSVSGWLLAGSQLVTLSGWDGWPASSMLPLKAISVVNPAGVLDIRSRPSGSNSCSCAPGATSTFFTSSRLWSGCRRTAEAAIRSVSVYAETRDGRTSVGGAAGQLNSRGAVPGSTWLTRVNTRWSSARTRLACRGSRCAGWPASTGPRLAAVSSTETEGRGLSGLSGSSGSADGGIAISRVTRPNTRLASTPSTAKP
jgi:hypothetical protein